MLPLKNICAETDSVVPVMGNTGVCLRFDTNKLLLVFYNTGAGKPSKKVIKPEKVES